MMHRLFLSAAPLIAVALGVILPGCTPQAKQPDRHISPTAETPASAVSEQTATEVDQAAETEETPPPSAVVSPWPHIGFGPERQYVDLAATVVTREGDWMELLACSPGTQEYESILTVQARPSHIHLALLTLGLEPGNTLSYRETEDGFEIIPPSGPPVAIFILDPFDDTMPQAEIPASQWIRNQETGEPMPDNIWIFTGSAFTEYEGTNIYMADLTGIAISLVNFGEDLLARPTDLTNQTDAGAWNANTRVIPPVGTGIILRLRPVPQ